MYGGFNAICHYKGQNYQVTEGDSIAGGVIKSINSTKVVIKIDGKLLEFNVGL